MELLVRIVDKGLDIDHEKAGDVIEIRPDGHPWSDLEKTHPDAHIISAPILNTHAATLKQRHSSGKQVRGVKYPWKQYRLDLSKLPNAEQFKVNGRTQPMVVMKNEDVVNATIKVQ